MHVRATTINIQQGKMQEMIDIFKNSVIPAQKAQKGYQGGYLMTHANSNKALGISIWESEADMMASESSSGYLQEQVAKIGNLISGAPDFAHYELSVDSSA